MKFVCKLDRSKYRKVAEDITTDEVITPERIAHVMERHSGDYEKYGQYLREIVEAPDYVFAGNRPKTALILKRIPESDLYFKTILRLVTPDDAEGLKILS